MPVFRCRALAIHCLRNIKRLQPATSFFQVCACDVLPHSFRSRATSRVSQGLPWTEEDGNPWEEPKRSIGGRVSGHRGAR